MKTILASVYAVNPYKGSEDGTGWNLILQIARFNKVIAVTRENNRPHIEKYLKEFEVDESKNIHFEYYDLPYWARFWKRGSKGALLYYYLWQLFLPRFVRKQKLKFDIVHNLNFHNDWTPSLLWKFKKPFVWGPVGHHPQIPKNYIQPVYGTKKWLLDSIRWQAKNFFWKLDPFLSITKNKADYILAINSDVNRKLHVKNSKLVLMPAVATNDMLQENIQSAQFKIISVGRFVALKGFDVTIKAFAHFYSHLTKEKQAMVKLVLVGNGPELPFLKSTIKTLGIEEAVEIVLWVEREEMNRLYSESSLFFFPSHEGAGMVVPEALSCGLPVLCFDNAGPGEFITENCGIKIPYTRYETSIIAFGEALLKIFESPVLLKQLSKGARDHFENSFRWNIKGDLLKNIYEKIS